MEDIFIGNTKNFEFVKSCIEMKKPVIIHGDPGIGKTYSVYLIAKSLGLCVIELNASDERKKEHMEKILRDVKIKGIRPRIFLFDEADGIENYSILKKILEETKHPVVLTANELWKIPDYIQNKCKIVKYYPPSKRDVLELIKSMYGEKEVRFDKISTDIRNSIIAVIANSEPYKKINIYEEVEKVFKRKEFEFIDNSMWIWLIDNITRFYNGKELFDAVKIVADSALYDNIELLKAIPRTKKTNSVVYPYYLKRKKILEV